jgi:hypothetical protein
MAGAFLLSLMRFASHAAVLSRHAGQHGLVLLHLLNTGSGVGPRDSSAFIYLLLGSEWRSVKCTAAFEIVARLKTDAHLGSPTA